MIVEPFRVAHLHNLAYQPEQAYMREWMQANAHTYESSNAFAMVDSEGQTLACAGIQEVWPGRAQAWCMFSARIGGGGMLCATRAVRRFLDLHNLPRIEADVARDFPAGHRWMRVLGFRCETPEGRANFFDGRKFDLYARVQ